MVERTKGLTLMAESGHVFVVQGDLLTIHADDLLVPCDDRLNVTSRWRAVLGATESGDNDWIRPVGITAPDGFNGLNRKPMQLKHVAGGRRVWLVNSGGQPTDIEWLVAGIRNAIATVGSQNRTPRHGRARQLVAMPVFGIGSGGFAGQRGEVLDRILIELEKIVAAENAPDVALVLYARADYAAVQSRRRERAELPAQVERLGRLIRQGGLVLFIGAGAGASAERVSPAGTLCWLSWPRGRNCRRTHVRQFSSCRRRTQPMSSVRS